MYDELIKQLRECTAEQNGEKTLWHQSADAIEELQKQLREEKVDNVNLTGWLAEEHAKHLWIPVTERLPEPRQNVLAAWDNGEVWTVYQWWAEPEEGEDPLEYDDDIFYENGEFYSTKKRVTHWMPLPQPPESEATVDNAACSADEPSEKVKGGE